MDIAAMEGTRRRNLDRLKSLERILSPISLVLALASAAGTWRISSSIWLGIFVFLMVARFVAGCVPKIIFHDRRIYRTAFYLLWPVGGALVLWGAYSLWGMMWLAVILGLVGGTLVSILVGLLFFRDVATEDQNRESSVVEYKLSEFIEADPAATAMKARFSNAEWDELKRLPMMFWVRVAAADGAVSPKEIEAWADIVGKPREIEDPLLRMLIFETYAAFQRMGGNDTVRQTVLMLSGKRLEQATESAQKEGEFFGSLFDLSMGGTEGPHALEILERELSPEEHRSFGRAFSSLGLQVAMANGTPSKEQIEEAIRLVPPSSREDLLSRLGVDVGADSNP